MFDRNGWPAIAQAQAPGLVFATHCALRLNAARLPLSQRALSLLLERGSTTREPVHIHAESSDGTAKFWLYPEARAARSTGYTRRQLSELAELVSQRRDEIDRAWNDHFG